MKILTKKQADKNTKKAIERSEEAIRKLQKDRKKYTGRELRDIDEQIAQYRRTIAHFRNVLKNG